jgi:hypothetical protein
MATTKKTKKKPAAKTKKKPAAKKTKKPAAKKTKKPAAKKTKKPAAKTKKKAAAKTKKPAAKKEPSAKRAPAETQAGAPIPPPDAADIVSFLFALPPSDARALDADTLERLRARTHAGLPEALAQIGLGAFGDGFLRFEDPAALDDALEEWLGGFSPTRVPFARTALGDLVYFRDLRERARYLGLDDALAEHACDISMVDVRYKQTRMLATSVAEFFENLGDQSFLNGMLRKDLFDAALPRLGPPSANEVYGFVPALALGGSEDPDNLQRVGANEHLAILFQL